METELRSQVKWHAQQIIRALEGSERETSKSAPETSDRTRQVNSTKAGIESILDSRRFQDCAVGLTLTHLRPLHTRTPADKLRVTLSQVLNHWEPDRAIMPGTVLPLGFTVQEDESAYQVQEYKTPTSLRDVLVRKTPNADGSITYKATMVTAREIPLCIPMGDVGEFSSATIMAPTGPAAENIPTDTARISPEENAQPTTPSSSDQRDCHPHNARSPGSRRGKVVLEEMDRATPSGTRCPRRTFGNTPLSEQVRSQRASPESHQQSVDIAKAVFSKRLGCSADHLEVIDSTAPNLPGDLVMENYATRTRDAKPFVSAR